jgi:hypothetical protein
MSEIIDGGFCWHKFPEEKPTIEGDEYLCLTRHMLKYSVLRWVEWEREYFWTPENVIEWTHIPQRKENE